jgi:alanyl-tRNA synthetase
MQYNRDEAGQMHPLPKPSVDTGMGLERLVAVLQGVHVNYEIDLFVNLIQSAADIIGVKNEQQKSLRVIADHIRSCAFLIVDGVQPANDGRGYVLRRIIRRAIRHGNQLGAKELFFYRLVEPLCKEMGEAYPELVAASVQVEQALQQEEERFAETLEQGIKILEQDIKDMKTGDIPGETIFRLYDTYGFPVDLTADIARERQLGMDMDGFENCMNEQRDRARAAGSFQADYSHSLDASLVSAFTGYEQLKESSTITALVHDGNPVEELLRGQEGSVVLDETPFYAESGGQVGDQGSISIGSTLFNVADTQKQGSGAIVHIGKLEEGVLRIGDRVQLQVDAERRQAIVMNHSATHLLHAALRQVLGTHVTQKGSLVDAERLRFDFSHPNPVKHDELAAIEKIVNQQIRANHEAVTRLMQQDEAIAAGAMALFGEKYDDEVRVLSMSDFSVELCGGTHVERTGDIGLFKITLETGIAAGVRRIEAVTGQTALDCMNQIEHDLDVISSLVKGSRHDIADNVRSMADRLRVVDKELEQLKSVLASTQGDDMASGAVDVKGVMVLAEILDNADVKSLRETVDQLKNKLGSAAIVLSSVKDGKVTLIAGVTKDVSKQVPAGELVNMVAEQVGGRGGGRPDMAQAGGNDAEALPVALATVAQWVESRLN